MTNPTPIKPATGKLGVLLPGMGAVATTFIAGVFAVRKGLAKPIGSLTQMGTIRLGKRTDDNSPKIKDFVPLAGLDDLVFGGWDIYEDNAYQAASNARAFEAYSTAEPVLDGVGIAAEVVPGMGERMLLHAGPPIEWARMCGPMQGAIVGACLLEGWAADAEAARKKIRRETADWQRGDADGQGERRDGAAGSALR